MGIHDESPSHHVGAIKVRALIPNAMRQIRRKQAPFVAASVLLRRQAERADLLIGPVPSPLLLIYSRAKREAATRSDVAVEVAVRICEKAVTRALPRRFLGRERGANGTEENLVRDLEEAAAGLSTTVLGVGGVEPAAAESVVFEVSSGSIRASSDLEEGLGCDRNSSIERGKPNFSHSAGLIHLQIIEQTNGNPW